MPVKGNQLFKVLKAKSEDSGVLQVTLYKMFRSYYACQSFVEDKRPRALVGLIRVKAVLVHTLK